MRFLQMRRSITLFGLCSAGGVLRVLECLLKTGLILAKISLLLQMRSDLRGKPVYLGLAMTAEGLLRLKPQNLLINLPLSAAV